MSADGEDRSLGAEWRRAPWSLRSYVLLTVGLVTSSYVLDGSPDTTAAWLGAAGFGLMCWVLLTALLRGRRWGWWLNVLWSGFTAVAVALLYGDVVFAALNVISLGLLLLPSARPW